MTPAAAIAMLDRQLAQHGQSVTLRRLVSNQPDAEHATRAFVRNYRPQEVTAGITIGSSNVVLSPTGLAGSAFAADLPKAVDKIVILGRQRNILAAEPVVVDDVLVRINLVVAG